MFWIILLGVIVYIGIGTAWAFIYYSWLDLAIGTDKLVNAWLNMFFWPITIICVALFPENNVDSPVEANRKTIRFEKEEEPAINNLIANARTYDIIYEDGTMRASGICYETLVDWAFFHNLRLYYRNSVPYLARSNGAGTAKYQIEIAKEEDENG